MRAGEKLKTSQTGESSIPVGTQKRWRRTQWSSSVLTLKPEMFPG